VVHAPVKSAPSAGAPSDKWQSKTNNASAERRSSSIVLSGVVTIDTTYRDRESAMQGKAIFAALRPPRAAVATPLVER
jgi:hypothetical protein